MKGHRGKIVCRDRASQLVNFSEMVFNNTATPTDIDGFLELRDKFFIFFDLKHENAEKIRGGQKMAYERLTRAIHNPDNNKYCVTLIAKHNTPTEIDIQADECLVTDCYFDGVWHDVTTEGVSLKDYIDSFISQFPDEKAQVSKTLDELLQKTKLL